MYRAWCSEIGSLTSLGMHLNYRYMHPVTEESQFHCTRLYIVAVQTKSHEHFLLTDISKKTKRQEAKMQMHKNLEKDS